MSLQLYSNQLEKKFKKEELFFFPNSYRIFDIYITYAGQFFDDIIVKNIVPIKDLPPVLQCNYLNQQKIQLPIFGSEQNNHF